MADVITQFLVGIGVKYDDNGQKKFEDGMSSMQSVTLRAGGVIASALAAAGVVVDQNARHIARVNLEATRMTASTQYVLNYGAAIERMGGSADSAMSNLQKMDQIMDDLHVRGQSGTLNELAQAGFNVSYLTQARNAPDLQERIANEYQHANPAQRRVASSVLGIDSATSNLYAGGGDYLKQQVEQAGSLEHINQNLINEAASYNLQLRDAQTAWNGLVNTATEHYLPAMIQVSKVSQGAFEWLDKFIQDHPKATDAVTAAAAPVAIGGGAATVLATAGKVFPAAARLAGPVGTAITGGMYASQAWNGIESKSNDWYGTDTTAGGNLKSNSPLGETWDFLNRHVITPLRHNQATVRSDTPSLYNPLSVTNNAGDHNYDNTVNNVSHNNSTTNNRGGDTVGNFLTRHENSTVNNAHDNTVNNATHTNTVTNNRGGDTDNSVRSVTHHYYSAADAQRPVAESDYERQAKATTQALHAAPVRVDNHLDAHLYMDGREIDHRIEQYENTQNQHSVNVNSPQVDR